jgi:hypothetical protein
LFEQATGGRGGRKNKLDPRNLLGESQNALAQINGAMSTIKNSVVDATGAGLRGGLEEASKSVTDIVDRVASMANGTIGTLSPSANKNPLAEIMAEEQVEEYKQRDEAAADEVEDGRSKLGLEHKLDTMKTIAEKATGLDLGEKRGGDDDEGSFQFSRSSQACCCMSDARGDVGRVREPERSRERGRARSAGDMGNASCRHGEAVGDPIRGEDASRSTNAMGNWRQKIADDRRAGRRGGAAGTVSGLLGGEKRNSATWSRTRSTRSIRSAVVARIRSADRRHGDGRRR